MASFKLTPEQEQFFKTVLMYISNERKSALIQVLDSKEAKTITHVSHEFMDYPGADPQYLPKQNVLSIFNRALSPLELAVEETVMGERGREAKAFRLTEQGEQVKRYAGFALEQMARLFDQSIYPILGTMGSSYDKVRPQQAVTLLYLVNEAMVSLRELIKNASLTNGTHIGDIMNDLSSFKDAQGNPIPLIEINSPKLEEGIRGYQWVRGYSIPTATAPREKWKRLVQALYSNPNRVWTAAELAKECGYATMNSAYQALSYLEDRGYLTSGLSTELAQVRITIDGRRLIYSLFEPIRGDIVGDKVSKGIIDRNPPMPNNIVRVLGYYVGIKGRERAGEIVLQQMQGKQK